MTPKKKSETWTTAAVATLLLPLLVLAVPILDTSFVVAKRLKYGEPVYAPDRQDLFARTCGYFDSAHFNILDAKVHTTTIGYALDTFLVVSPSLEPHYRDLTAYVENQLTIALQGTGPLPEPGRGRISRRVKSFPITPRVTLRPDERAQRWLLAVSASDRVSIGTDLSLARMY